MNEPLDGTELVYIMSDMKTTRTETTAAPVGRPSDPSTISFDARCFAQDGEREVFTVCLSAPNYPKRFDNRAAAEAFARKTGRTVGVSVEPIMKRISWT